jgi:cholesterol oxidase
MAERDDFDAIVVGSGFGGSVSACRLAQDAHDVLVLERGRAWPPGSFPRTPGDLEERGFWEPEDGALGLIDVQVFDGFTALVSSGLGGGSLIYANVLLRKDPRTFVRERLDSGGRERWPLGATDLLDGYTKAERMLRATPYPAEYRETTPKTAAFARAANGLGRGTVEFPPLAVAFAPEPGGAPAPRMPVAQDAPNLFGLPRSTCRLCGECDIGCNDGAKQTLDHTYLSAARAAGAQIRCGCEVTALRPLEDGRWEVTYTQRAKLRDERYPELHDPDPERGRVRVRARVLVLSAGVFGTARLLLGARGALPGLSPRLGTAVSVNGDMLAFCFDTAEPMRPSQGPVITTALRLADDESDSGRELLLQDAGQPAFMDWIWQARAMPRDLAALLGNQVWTRTWEALQGRRDTRLGADLRAAFQHSGASANMLPLLAMGRDVPDGVLRLRDGELECTWSLEPSQGHYDEIDRVGRAVSEQLGGRFVDGRLARKLRTMTVHPLGGVPMGDSWAEGVVDAFGEVFGHPGLFVADGSVMPGPIGPNPSLTIAACAERFSARMKERLA